MVDQGGLEGMPRKSHVEKGGVKLDLRSWEIYRVTLWGQGEGLKNIQKKKQKRELKCDSFNMKYPE